ncbi:MAG: hypothetical protein HC831_09590 [Chloroflexia bacterium]|nr:hypothetical protein [Chloroflexia bacterium]
MKRIIENTSILLLIGMFLSTGFLSYAQDNSISTLVLTRVKNNKVVYLKANRRIKIWTDKGKFKGRIENLTNTTITIDNQRVNIEDIYRIRVKSVGAQILGGTVFAGGSLITAAGISTIANASSQGCSSGIARAVGTVVAAGGGILVVAGTSIFFIGKRYDCRKHWKLSTAVLSE